MTEATMIRLEAKMDTIIALLGGGVSAFPQFREVSERREGVTLPRMTPKQHATMQMLVRGAGNPEIAERFGVTVNTAKVHVRSLFAKFGVNDRERVAELARRGLTEIDAAEYARMSGGLPKNWDASFVSVQLDPHRHLYRSGD